jgi:hypothetical protein
VRPLLLVPTTTLLQLAAGVGCAPGPAPGGTASPDLVADPTVVIAVIDGARSQETFGETPSSATGLMPWQSVPRIWDELMPLGARATNAWVVGSTTTVPAHATLLTGRREPVANYPPADGPGAYLLPLPPLGQLLRAQDDSLGGGQVYTVANTELLELVEHSHWPGLPQADGESYRFVDGGSGEGSRDDREVIEALKERMEPGDTRLALINLHQVDRSGHNGPREEYPAMVRALDGPLADLWAWLQAQEPYRGRSYLLLLSDHGRHNDADTEPPWRHHGCTCSGCRHVPVLLLGPGVRAGEDLHSPMVLADLGPTLAGLLGLPMPWADGLVRDDLLLEPTGLPSRSGVADLALAGPHLAELRYRGDPGQRASLQLDGHRVSDPEAWLVEAPSIASDGQRGWACWRELSRPQDEQSRLYWRHRCAQIDGVSWEPMDFAESKAGPYGRVGLLPTDQGLLAAWVHSPNGSTSGGSADPGDEGSTVALRVALLDGEEWVTAEADEAPGFPTGLSLAARDGQAWIAVAGGRLDAQSAMRHTRRIWVLPVDLEGDQPSIGDAQEVPLDFLAPEGTRWRVEHPALRANEQGVLLLAAVGLASDGSSVAIMARSADQGANWSRRTALPMPDQPAPHTGPAWLNDRALFAVVDPETQASSICAGGLDQAVACLDTGSERILQLRVHGETIHAVVDAGQGRWERRQWKADSLELR